MTLGSIVGERSQTDDLDGEADAAGRGITKSATIRVEASLSLAASEEGDFPY